MVFKAVFLLGLLAVTASAAPACDSGCTLAGEGVCGANGITFMNECLATCAGTAVAHPGACAGPRAAGGAVTTANAAAPGKHPIGQFLAFDDAVTAAADGTVRVASASDISRFADQGFSLVGPAKLGEFSVGKPRESPNAGVSTAAFTDAASGERRLFAVRVLPAEGLVYVSDKPIIAAPGADAASAPSVIPDAASDVAAAAASESEEVSAAAAGPEDSGKPSNGWAPLSAPADAVAQSRVPNRRAGRQGKLQAPGWDEITSLQDYPHKAVGWLNIGFPQGSGSCSGSVFANQAVITAAHCVYDRYSGSTIKSARFTPHNFYNPRGALTQPFGKIDAYGFDFLSGWRENDDMDVAWVSDMAVILLSKPIGAQTGMLGFAYNDKGYSGAITGAGYPGETPRVQGMFYRLHGPCVIKDTDGTDGQLEFKSPTQNTCLTGCSIAEQGQSGQPIWVQDGQNFVIRGVLSHGPPTGTCNGFDTYTEIDKLHFNFLNGYRTWTPPASPPPARG